MTSDPHALIVVVAASLAAWLMTKAGLAKHGLENRHNRRVCPSCGRFDGCSCR